MLNIVTTKQKFISQIMTSKSPARVYEDTDEMVITYSEMQAITSGNPMIKEKIELDTEVARLNLLQSEYRNNRFRLQDMITTELPQKISKFKQLIEKSERLAFVTPQLVSDESEDIFISESNELISKNRVRK